MIMSNADSKSLRPQSSQGEIDAFLNKLAATPAVKPAGKRGRLIFAMDATASREPTWRQACEIQGQMFKETMGLGGLEVQICYFRGHHECRASRWMSASEDLLRCMRKVDCQTGYTQIEKVLRHAREESRREKVNAVVYVGDCMEEDLDRLGGLAGELGMLNVPVFLFQEGFDPIAERAFREIARLTRGAYCRFDANSPQQLRDLLSAVAVYAAGGRQALEDYSARQGGVTLQLTRQFGQS
jgi:hypothetical protein